MTEIHPDILARMQENAIMVPTMNNAWGATIREDIAEFTIDGIQGYNGTVHQRSPFLLVVKVPGGKHFASRGEQAYHGAQFAVFKIERESNHGLVTALRVRKIIAFDIRKK